jgi:hypothetical protein
MAGGFCQHGRIWTTCPTCGKDVISKAKASRRKKDDDDYERPVQRVPARPAAPPPAEPPVTDFESGE